MIRCLPPPIKHIFWTTCKQLFSKTLEEGNFRPHFIRGLAEVSAQPIQHIDSSGTSSASFEPNGKFPSQRALDLYNAAIEQYGAVGKCPYDLHFPLNRLIMEDSIPDHREPVEEMAKIAYIPTGHQGKSGDFPAMAFLFERGRPLLAISFLKYLISDGRLDKRKLHPAVKLFTMIRAFGVQLQPDERAVYEHLRSESLHIPNEFIRGSLLLMLDACRVLDGGAWRLDDVDRPLPEREETFLLLASIAIQSHDIEMLRLLCEKMAPNGPPLIATTLHPIFWQIMKGLKKLSDAKDSLFSSFVSSLIEIFLSQLTKMTGPISKEEFDSTVLPILEKCAENNILRVEQAKFNGELCSRCGTKLAAIKELTPDQFAKLSKRFNALLVDEAKTFRGGTRRELQVLDRVVSIVRRSTKKNCQPLVVDALNVANGTYEDTLNKMSEFYRIILKLHQKNFSPILLVGKGQFPPAYQQKLRLLNAYFLTVSKRSKDDAFTISAAFMLGPNAHILTNDRFCDFAENIQGDVKEFFRIWYRSRAINFHKCSGNLRIPTCSLIAQRSENGNFHLFREDNEGFELGNKKVSAALTDIKLYCVAKPGKQTEQDVKGKKTGLKWMDQKMHSRDIH